MLFANGPNHSKIATQPSLRVSNECPLVSECILHELSCASYMPAHRVNSELVYHLFSTEGCGSALTVSAFSLMGPLPFKWSQLRQLRTPLHPHFAFPSLLLSCVVDILLCTSQIDSPKLKSVHIGSALSNVMHWPVMSKWCRCCTFILKACMFKANLIDWLRERERQTERERERERERHFKN